MKLPSTREACWTAVRAAWCWVGAIIGAWNAAAQAMPDRAKNDEIMLPRGKDCVESRRGSGFEGTASTRVAC